MKASRRSNFVNTNVVTNRSNDKKNLQQWLSGGEDFKLPSKVRITHQNSPKSFWKSLENRKRFLEETAKELNIRTPSDWGQITYRRLCALGGGPLLSYYNGSLFFCLQSIFQGFNYFFCKYLEDVTWKREWFQNITKVPNSHWKSMENRRKYLDAIAIKLNIKTPSDWGKVAIRHVYSLGGYGILSYYNGSLFTCLQSVYKGIS